MSPDGVGLHEMADAPGWDDYVKLDRVIAWNIFVQVRLPDGRQFAGHEIAERFDFEPPHLAGGAIAIAPRPGVSDWWAGPRGHQ